MTRLLTDFTIVIALALRGATWMICPTCHNLMIVVEHNEIELDHCTSCSGVWFDAGELGLMLEKMGRDGTNLPLADILSTPEVKSAEKKRKCPICGQKMKKVHIGREPGVLIDVCPNEDGLWFDGGEVSQLIAQCAEKRCAGSDSEKRIFTFLGDTFKAVDHPE